MEDQGMEWFLIDFVYVPADDVMDIQFYVTK